MKPALLVLASALVLPGVALAQAAPAAPRTAPQASGPAAANLPNSFDGPVSQASPARPARPTGPAPAAAAESSPAKIAAAEAALRKTITAMQAGSPNYADMSDDLAAKVREQSAAILPLFQQLGALESLRHQGAQDSAELFRVNFANAPTEWIIALNAEGKIVALLFRPAEDGA